MICKPSLLTTKVKIESNNWVEGEKTPSLMDLERGLTTTKRQLGHNYA